MFGIFPSYPFKNTVLMRSWLGYIDVFLSVLHPLEFLLSSLLDLLTCIHKRNNSHPLLFPSLFSVLVIVWHAKGIKLKKKGILFSEIFLKQILWGDNRQIMLFFFMATVIRWCLSVGLIFGTSRGLPRSSCWQKINGYNCCSHGSSKEFGHVQRCKTGNLNSSY